MNLALPHNLPQMAQTPDFTPGGPIDPVAVMWPGLPFFARFVVSYILMWFGIYMPMRAAMRRSRDMRQLYNLSMTMDVAALSEDARQYTLGHLIADCAPARRVSFQNQALGGVSPLPEMDRISPAKSAASDMIARKVTGWFKAKMPRANLPRRARPCRAAKRIDLASLRLWKNTGQTSIPVKRHNRQHLIPP